MKYCYCSKTNTCYILPRGNKEKKLCQISDANMIIDSYEVARDALHKRRRKY